MANNGDAKFNISGSSLSGTGASAIGKVFTLNKSNADPDGDGTFSYSWETSSNGLNSWSEVGQNSSYTITSSDAGKNLRSKISYTDNQGNSTVVIADPNSSLNNSTAVDKSLTQNITFGETSSSAENKINIGTNGSITLGSFFDNQLNLKSDLLALSNNYGESSYGFDIWLNQESKISIRSLHATEGYHRTSGHEISYNSTPEYISKNNNYFSDVYELLRNWSYVNLKIPGNDGSAAFSISGTPIAGENLTISEDSSDPDGAGTLSVIWQTSSDEVTWNEVGTGSSYQVTSSDNDKQIRALVSYTDGEGFIEDFGTADLGVLKRTYSLSTSMNSYQEGYTLTTTASSENVSQGTTLYWSISGTGVVLSDFSSGELSGSGIISSSGEFSFTHNLAIDGVLEGYETIDIKLFSDENMTSQVGETKSFKVRDSAIEEQIAQINTQLGTIVSLLNIGEKYTLENIRDFDGNLHAYNSNVGSHIYSSYKYQGILDVNSDSIKEAIYTNQNSKRWVTTSINSSGKVDYSDYGENGTTRVVGIYIDPLVTSGDVVQFSDYDSQHRFQNDLAIDNLLAITSGDYDGDGFQEIYWKTADGTAYLRSLMHADGNIQYANYQNITQVSDYLTSHGNQSLISEII